jgi:hypothetical protein
MKKIWYYVLGENSSKKYISKEFESIELANAHINHCKKVDKDYSTSMIYSLLQTLPN